MVNTISDLARTADFDILPSALASDVKRSIDVGLGANVVFPQLGSPLEQFQLALDSSIKDIESGQGCLLRRFLELGPYERGGAIPEELRDKRLSDDDTGLAIAFIHGFMVSAFQGALAELLAIEPCVEILRELTASSLVPAEAQLYVGDAVKALTSDGRYAKSSDMHLLHLSPNGSLTVIGLVEIKSYSRGRMKVLAQMQRQANRLCAGACLTGQEIRADKMSVSGPQELITIRVRPEVWLLPRSFHFEYPEGRKFLHVDEPRVPKTGNAISRANRAYDVVLRWSREALASSAYDMTFNYIEALGERMYADYVPPEWAGMTPREAGINRAKAMMHYALMRARTPDEEQRAIAVCNTYSFGYALGSSFRDKKGRRQMLFVEELDQVLANGKSKKGFGFRRSRREVPALSEN